MITFTARLVLRSTRWVAPFLVMLVWVIGAIGGGRASGLELTSLLFPAYLIVGTWFTIITGNIDDDAHRDLVAAATGSASRLHLWRSATVLAVTAIVASAVAVLIAVVAQAGRSTLTVIAVAVAVSVAGILTGIGIGTLLHRPILRHRGLSVLIATAGCVMVMLLSPIQSVHQSLNADEIDNVCSCQSDEVVVVRVARLGMNDIRIGNEIDECLDRVHEERRVAETDPLAESRRSRPTLRLRTISSPGEIVVPLESHRQRDRWLRLRQVSRWRPRWRPGRLARRP